MSNIRKINKNKELIDFDISNLKIKDILSYSRIDTFKQCEYKYFLKYEQKNYTSTTSLPLELGTLCHYAMEMKYENEDMNIILDKFYNGYYDENNQFHNGLNKLKKKYTEEYYKINDKSNMSYEDKIDVFLDRLQYREFDKEWKCIGRELPFVIVYKDYTLIKGFIDRVDENIKTGELRVIDYKTNNKEFDKSFLATPLQMYIYSLACQELYGKVPVVNEYDLLFLDEIQEGGTKGFLLRAEKKLDKLLDGIYKLKQKGEDYYKPSATPLCHWCDYCKTNNNADSLYNMLCDYHSLWTRENKCFEKNKLWQKPIEESDGWDEEDW